MTSLLRSTDQVALLDCRDLHNVRVYCSSAIKSTITKSNFMIDDKYDTALDRADGSQSNRITSSVNDDRKVLDNGCHTVGALRPSCWAERLQTFLDRYLQVLDPGIFGYALEMMI